MQGSDLQSLESQRYDAMLSNDSRRLGQLISDEAVYVHSNGARDSKEEYLGRISSGGLVYLNIKHSEDTCLVSGSTGIVLGEMVAEVILDGSRVSIANKHMVVWVENDGTWRLMAYHARLIA